jgi:hypothetical protein
MCNKVSITCGSSGLKNAHLQLVHGSTLRLFLLLVPSGCSVTACEMLSIMRICRHGQLLASPGTANKVQDLGEWSRKQGQAARGKLPFLMPGLWPAPHFTWSRIGSVSANDGELVVASLPFGIS